MSPKIKSIIDKVVLGTGLFSALVLGNAALAVAGVIIVMLYDRLPARDHNV